jgi:hypothetical protein
MTIHYLNGWLGGGWLCGRNRLCGLDLWLSGLDLRLSWRALYRL